MIRLENGQIFPSLQLPLVGGGTLSLPEDLDGSFGVVLVYRGAWCPFCNAQLAAFGRATDSRGCRDQGGGAVGGRRAERP